MWHSPRPHLSMMGNVQDTSHTYTQRRFWWGGRVKVPSQPHPAFVREALKAAETGDIGKLRKIYSCVRGGITKLRCETTLTTPLHAAATNSHGYIVKYLLGNGADPNLQDSSAETPLHTAAKAGATECLLLLLQAKALVEIEDAWGRTPLLKAVVYNRPKCVYWLLDAGAKTNVLDHDGLSPVHVAASYGQVSLLRKLVKHGARLDVVNRKGKLPISKAINAGQVTMVQELIKYGARTYHEEHCVVKDAISKLAQSHPAAKENDIANYKIIETVISAHGYTLDEENLELFLSIFRSLDPKLFLPILMRLALVSGKPKSSTPHQLALHHVEQLQKFLPDDFKLFSLENLAKRKIRACLMDSGRNVAWASAKLDVAPMLIKIILLQDVF
ncbi:serine/threonine-protein phosphatase 6 regulatory ankyrin repeat subunit A-like [Haliotis cracherodii]|uniref:serine/threonine-protein phosphatase 6 regulatory ankyrin repeat subunit A-like n=1 Tax=Haliotis cracherodii TaxID=6455 RepID=UPI0039E85B8D